MKLGFDPEEPARLTLVRALAGLTFIIAIMLVLNRLGYAPMDGPLVD